MKIDRYSRQFAPSDPNSVPDYLNREHQKLEQSIDSIRTAAFALTASEIANVPAGTIAAVDVQAAINELNGDMTSLTAASVANVPSGGIASTNVQAALTELDTEKAPLSGATFVGPITVPSPLTLGTSQVLTTRQLGWAADTGTAKRTANATYAGTADAAYTQTTIQTLMDALRDVSQALKALKDDLITHGIIGP